MVGAARPGLKVLFVSAYADEKLLERGVSTERATFLRKPFSPQAFGRRVRRLLAAAEGSSWCGTLPMRHGPGEEQEGEASGGEEIGRTPDKGVAGA